MYIVLHTLLVGYLYIYTSSSAAFEPLPSFLSFCYTAIRIDWDYTDGHISDDLLYFYYLNLTASLTNFRIDILNV